MEIKYLGSLAVLLKGKKESVLINGDNWETSGARVVAVTEDKYDRGNSVEGKVVLRGPGEYEVGGVEVWATGNGEGKTVYVINVDGVSICYLGDLASPLSEKKEERIGGVDVLIGVVGKEGLGGKKLMALAKTWGANYLLPIGFSGRDENLVKFLDEVDREDLQPVASLKVDRDDLPEGMEVVVLGG